MMRVRNLLSAVVRLTAAVVLLAGLSATAAPSGAITSLKQSVATRIAGRLESRFERRPLSEGSVLTGIIALGGNPDRAREALRIARFFPEAKVILSGPGPEEEALLASAPELVGRLVIDHRPLTTFQNAVYSRELAQPSAGDRWLVVTSAIQMPRSVGAFQAVGFAVDTWPVHDTRQLIGSGAGAVQHEVLGLAYYRLRGRTKSLFPKSIS